jgi:hypothetical protein
LTWEAPVAGDTPTFYSIYYGTEESSVDVLLGTVAYPTVTYDHTPVDDGAIFYYEVFANNEVGQSESGVANSGASWTIPSEPMNIAVVASDVGELTLTWEVPTYDGGTEIVNYKVYTGTTLAEVEAETTPTGTLPDTQLNYILSGLDDGFTLYYQVTAETIIGESVRMNTVSATTWNVPDAPINAKTVDGNTAVTFSWDSPVNYGGTEISEYHVYRGVVLGSLVEIGTTTAATTSFVSTGLTNGTTYYFAVSAENSIGEGVQCLAVSAKPEAAISTEENLLQWVCDSVGMSVYKAYGVASFTPPISDKKKILGVYASFLTTDNVTAATNIIVSVDTRTVYVYEDAERSSNLYDLLVMVLYR